MHTLTEHTDWQPWLTGPMSLDDLRATVERGDITTVLWAVPDLLGRPQGKRLSASVFLDRVASGHAEEACAYILATDVNMTALEGFALTGWDQGYQDLTVRPDLDTLRALPYLPGVALVLCDAFDHHGAPVEVAPRRILRRQLDHLAELGFEMKVGLESEFVLCSGRRPVGGHNLDYSLTHPPALADFFLELEETLRDAGTPVEAVKTEGAPGQIEVTFPYGPALNACDSYLLYRHALRHLAERHGLTPTFMAAPFTGTHSGLHLHLHLWRDGEPAFATEPDGELPEVLRQAIGGLLSGLPHLAPLYAPVPNSYKRYATSHAFTPQSFNWGHDNRGCAIRLTGRAAGTHLENRLPGANANPYLALAATCAALAHGLTGKVTPPDPCDGDPYADRQALPVRRDLVEAASYFGGSTLAQEALGADVVRHYARAAQAEIDEHHRQVTDVEQERGFARA